LPQLCFRAVVDVEFRLRCGEAKDGAESLFWEGYYFVTTRDGKAEEIVSHYLQREATPHLGEVLKRLAQQKECEILEGHLRPDHIHLLISIPPKYAVSQVVGFIKGKSAIHLARTYGERKRNFVGQQFWARGYFVSTVGERRGDGEGIHPEPGEGGQTIGADAALVNGRPPRRWPQ